MILIIDIDQTLGSQLSSMSLMESVEEAHIQELRADQQFQ